MSKKYILSLAALCSLYSAAFSPSLLIKIPTRSRPDKLCETLDKYYKCLADQESVAFLISCDTDDLTMNNPEVIARLASYPNLTCNFHSNTSKVEAFNRDLECYDFEMVLGAADDTEPCVHGFDRIIIDTMRQQFPNLDGVLNIHDGNIGEECNTLPIIGRTFFNRFGYLYNPEYKALVCDVEITSVSKMLKKEYVINQTLIRHNHPVWGRGEQDELYTMNEQFHQADLATLKERRTRLYDLSLPEIEATESKLWSILIATDANNQESTTKLIAKLNEQIRSLGIEDAIELLVFETDAQGVPSYVMKNRIIGMCSGKYVQFIEAGHDISDSFIELIYPKLLKSPDCVSFCGIYAPNNEVYKTVIQSREYTDNHETDATCYRPPSTLNPMRRYIAIQFHFWNCTYLDSDWAKRIVDSKLIRTEEFIETPYYFFQQQNLI